jgi:O-antigen ligase
MTPAAVDSSVAVGKIGWRALEWFGVAFALFIFSGAILPLLLAPNGLDEAARAQLRATQLPAYAVTLLLLSRHLGALLLLMRRNIAFIMLLALAFISILWSISGSVSLVRAIALAMSSTLACLIALRFSSHQFALLVAIVFGSSVFASLALALVAPGVASMPASDAAAGLRGVFLHKNVLGWCSAVTLLAGFVLLRERIAPRICAFALVGASAVCLIASNSATGLVAAIAAVALVLFYSAFRRQRDAGRFMLLLVSLGAAALLVLGFGALVAPALEALGRDATLTGRTILWEPIDAEIGRNILLGFGYQAFWSDANPDAWRIRSLVNWPAPHAHNGYRDILLNFGLVGAATFLWLIVKTLIEGMTLHLRRPRDGWLMPNVLIGMFLVMNATESLFLVQNEALSVLFSATVLMVGLRAPEASATETLR